MNEKQAAQLQSLVGQFIRQENLSPSSVAVTFSPTVSVVVIKKLPGYNDDNRKLVD